MEWLLWDQCECQAEFGNIAKITDATVSFWALLCR